MWYNMFKIQVKIECSGEACSISALICTNEDTLCIHGWQMVDSHQLRWKFISNGD